MTTPSRNHHHHHHPSSHPSPSSSARLRQIVIVSVICLAIYCFLLVPEASLNSTTSGMVDTFPNSRSQSKSSSSSSSSTSSAESAVPWKQTHPASLLSNPSLTASQCRAAFPLLEREIDFAVAQGPFDFNLDFLLNHHHHHPHGDGSDSSSGSSTGSSSKGPSPRGLLGQSLLARIRSNQLTIVRAARRVDLSRDMLQHRSATLHQVARALLTAPEPLPDTVFAFNHHDDPRSETWSYARPADPDMLVVGVGGSGGGGGKEKEKNEKDDEASSSSSSTTTKKKKKHYFPIPHFSFYAWPLPFIGSHGRAAAAISALEASTPFSDKIPRAVWRGTTWFNSARAGRMRQDLVAATRGKLWADVEALEWTTSTTTRKEGEKVGGGDNGGGGMTKNATNALPIPSFCAYKYIIHTEGVTYSGRFQYHQLCGSVVLTPPLAWMQHLTHMVRPVYSFDLLASGDDDDDDVVDDDEKRNDKDEDEDEDKETSERKQKKKKDAPGIPYPAPWHTRAWPPTRHSSSFSSAAAAAEGANMVFVSPDWSDLEATVRWLERHPAVAEGIARNQRDLFHGGGYFSTAAEMCYWRALIRGWSEVVRMGGVGEGEEEQQQQRFDDPDLYDGEMTWEEFSLSEIHR
ncbi:hypothetical protein F4778DRAFT_596189 [Xylariomycetidae sp. FL2044]|nr:hypothetical protein F4778DRAFT_596189 [Xylariomycetidae sp. FL2044]